MLKFFEVEIVLKANKHKRKDSMISTAVVGLKQPTRKLFMFLKVGLTRKTGTNLQRFEAESSLICFFRIIEIKVTRLKTRKKSLT